MKTEVYSWRVSTNLKAGLEREARRRKTSISAILDLAAQEWLMKSSGGANDDKEQRRLQRAASKCFGVLASGDARRSESVSRMVREHLRRRYGR
jgi:hypothetical protein